MLDALSLRFLPWHRIRGAPDVLYRYPPRQFREVTRKMLQVFIISATSVGIGDCLFLPPPQTRHVSHLDSQTRQGLRPLALGTSIASPQAWRLKPLTSLYIRKWRRRENCGRLVMRFASTSCNNYLPSLQRKVISIAYRQTLLRLGYMVERRWRGRVSPDVEKSHAKCA